jgi:hypothetical protein
VSRSETVNIFASASIPRCSAANSLRMNWTESSRSVRSTSADPRFFRLPASQLTAGKTYNLTVNVTDDTGQYNVARAYVTVKRSDLVVQIVGGDRVARSNAPLTLSIEAYDPDDRRTALSFVWSCVRGGAEYGAACGLPSGLAMNRDTLSAGFLQGGSTYVFSVTASTTDGRSNTATATIAVAEGRPPLLYIQTLATAMSGTLAGDRRVNPSARFTLQGFADLSNSTSASSTNLTLSWSVVAGSFVGGAALSAVAMSTIRVDLNMLMQPTTLYPLPLTISAGALLGGATYTMRLRAVDHNRGALNETAVVAEVSFTTNAPPTSGGLSVTPRSGSVLTTQFQLSAYSWVDDVLDYPLVYSFYYAFDPTGAGSNVALKLASYLPDVDGVYLPQVCAESRVIVPCDTG